VAVHSVGLFAGNNSTALAFTSVKNSQNFGTTLNETLDYYSVPTVLQEWLEFLAQTFCFLLRKEGALSFNTIVIINRPCLDRDYQSHCNMQFSCIWARYCIFLVSLLSISSNFRVMLTCFLCAAPEHARIPKFALNLKVTSSILFTGIAHSRCTQWNQPVRLMYFCRYVLFLYFTQP